MFSRTTGYLYGIGSKMKHQGRVVLQRVEYIRCFMEYAMLAYIRLKNKKFFIVIITCDGCLFTICTRSLSAEEG